MKRNHLLLMTFGFLWCLLVVSYLNLRSAEAGTSFLTAAQSRIYRVNVTDIPTLFDPNGTTIVLAVKGVGATPAAENTMFFCGDANAYTTKQVRITQATNGKVRYYIDAGGTGESTNALSTTNVNLLTLNFKKDGDGNTIGKLWMNGDAVVTKSFTAEPNCITWGVLSVGSVAGLNVQPLTGELEQVALYYHTDPNTAAALHTAVWNGGDVLSLASDSITATYPPPHRWALTGGTNGDTVVGTDVYIDDAGTAADGKYDLETVTSTDANYPEYTTSWLITPTTLTVADSNNVTFSGPCVGPWTGGITYAITGDANWTVTPQDANHTWWSATDASGSGAGTAAIALTADANALGFGTHTSTIVFTNTDTGGLGSTTRDLTLTVYDANALDLTDPNHTTGYTWTVTYATTNDANQFVTGITNNALCEVVANVSPTDPNWTLSGVDPNFCTADGSGGYDCNMAPLDDMAVTLELDPNVATTMPLGSWTSYLRFKADDDANNWVDIPLTINVTTGSIDDPNTRVWSWVESVDPNDVDPNQYTVNFTNTGPTGNIIFGFTDPNVLSMISLDAICTYTPGVGITCPIDQDANVLVTLAVDPNYGIHVAAGTHDFTLNIYPEGDANAPTTVPMQLDVSASAGGVTRYVSASAGLAGNSIAGFPNDCLNSEFPCGTLDYVYDVVQLNGGGDTVVTAGGFTTGLTIDGSKAVAFVKQTTGPTVTSASADLITIANGSDGDVSFTDFTFVPATSKRIMTGANGGTGDPNIAFTNCNFQFPSSYAPSVAAFYLITTNGDTETLSFTDCNVVSPAAISTDFLYAKNQTSITLDGLDLPISGYGCRDLVSVGGAIGTLLVQNGTGKVGRTVVAEGGGTAALTTLKILGNKYSSLLNSGTVSGSLLSWGVSAGSGAQQMPATVQIIGNQFTGHGNLIYLSDPNYGDGTSAAILSGSDIEVIGNTLRGTSNAAITAHGTGPYVTAKRVVETDNSVVYLADVANTYGGVFKCDDAEVANNIFVARTAATLSGGADWGSSTDANYAVNSVDPNDCTGMRFTRNTCVTTGNSGYALQVLEFNTDATITSYPIFWQITGNILDAGGYTSSYALYFPSGGSPHIGYLLGICDRNVYRAGASNRVASLYGQSPTSLATLKTAWTTISGRAANDLLSVVTTSPIGYRSWSTGDYRLSPLSAYGGSSSSDPGYGAFPYSERKHIVIP